MKELPLPRLPGRGHIRLAFSLFLAVGVLLSGWPILQHMQRRIALEAQASTLLSRPLEAEIALLLRRGERLSADAVAYHELLESAEAYLWEFKNNRESSLILKDVGNDDGELGLRALRAAFPKVTISLARLNAVLAALEQDWQALRNQASPERLREVGRELDDALQAARQQRESLARYGEIAEETGKRAAQFHRLAPQVAGRVPLAVGRVPDQLQQLRAAIVDLGEALLPFSRAAAARLSTGKAN